MVQERGRPGVSSGPEVSAPPGYRLIRLLGRGGMGEVYLAEDLTLGREVAIKFLRAEKTEDPDAQRRLLREARAAASVDHPSICTVHEAGQMDDGHVFIVMQYVEGESLASVLERGPLPVRDALTISAQLAEALAAAHKRGIVHRDLKPGNVMLTPEGRTKVLDLGIAKVAGEILSKPESSTRSATTIEGTIVGTPGYMSPEQVQQRPVDGRCDLFSLGAVLFECLTGRRAFQGASPLETIAQVLHVHPPAPSTWRGELTEGHDELCRRLLAKDPADRFQSAEEVVGAIGVLVPDTSRTVLHDAAGDYGGRRRRRRLMFAAAIVAALAAGIGGWVWSRPAGLPPVPPEADAWYHRGTDAIREGAYLSGRVALEEAIAKFPQHALAYARLAEANAELDDEEAAKGYLLQVSTLVTDESRLPRVERLRLQAVRALVLRDVDTSVGLYRELVERNASEPGSWLDLGRAQEAAGLRTAAGESYKHAIERDRQYAAAYLRLGYVQGLESQREEALAAFAEAERLYRASSDIEGQTEVLVKRGLFLDAIGELKAAKEDLQRALTLATSAKSLNQQVRIQLALSSVTASDGRFAESEKIAAAAIQQAMRNNLETVAADGLVDVAATLMQAGRLDDAAARVTEAIRLADRRGARRTAARARVQLASVHQVADRPAEALALVDEVLPFLQSNRYRRLELQALSISTRAHERQDNIQEARKMAVGVLSTAERMKDEAQIALALSNLASVTTALGEYPEALALRERAEAIHRRQEDQASLPYDLANRADLLVRLGRGQDADRVLSELEAGISKRLDAYVGRTRRAIFLRALAAATSLRCNDALPQLRRLEADRESQDSASVLAPAVRTFCDAADGRAATAIAAPPSDTDRTLVRERQYWVAAAAWGRGDHEAALAESAKGLALLGQSANHELQWRLAAVGAAAARAAGDQVRLTELSRVSREAFERVKAGWKSDFKSYEERADLSQLRKRSGIV
jgi:tetratricopeptide (TPR) repeat protein/tRNA A-37 threonylcarbamoyl transferase component Bud32